MDAASLTALTDMVVGDALATLPLQVQALVGLLMVATGAWTAQRPGFTRAAAFVACTVVWARANGALEGFVLVSLTPEHGLTVADLLPPALLALVLLRVPQRDRRQVDRRAAPRDGQDRRRADRRDSLRWEPLVFPRSWLRSLRGVGRAGRPVPADATGQLEEPGPRE